MTEKELIRLSRKGNKQAFAELYGLYKDRLYRYACYRLGDTYDAQDAVCDTVLCAYEQIGSLKKHQHSAPGYLKFITSPVPDTSQGKLR